MEGTHAKAQTQARTAGRTLDVERSVEQGGVPGGYPQQPGGIRTPVIDSFSASMVLHHRPRIWRIFPGETAFSGLNRLYIG